MSTACPLGQNSDDGRTTFGLCLESVRTLDPTRPDPTRPVVGEGLPLDESPSPPVLVSKPTLQREVWQILVGGLNGLSENDHGRPWPYPRRDRLAHLLAEFDEDLCIRAAREAREIVQSQDRAPNVTNLFARKCADLAADRARRQAVRDEIQKALVR